MAGLLMPEEREAGCWGEWKHPSLRDLAPTPTATLQSVADSLRASVSTLFSPPADRIGAETEIEFAPGGRGYHCHDSDMQE